MKNEYLFLALFFLLSTQIRAQAELFVTNNSNISIFVNGTGFDDTIVGNVPLFVTGQIDLNGPNSIIYLRNEAQLLQSSNVVNTGSGYLERGQSGTASLTNYNYWGSPVKSAASSFAIDDILYYAPDGTTLTSVTPITWNVALDAIFPAQMSSYWLYAYNNNANDDYDAWEPMDENSTFNLGLGFTMKGSGSGPGTATQEYMFRGIPNNGNIINNVDDGNQTLVGNPYPSAIDAREFIRDNIPGGSANPGSTTSIVGPLRFWRQSTTNNSHYLAAYQGGYATLTLTGGVAAATFPSEIAGTGDAGNMNYRPGYYIPVAQGFFVDADPAAISPNPLEGPEPIQFKNSQRFFKKEALGVSVFLEPNDEGNDNNIESLEDTSNNPIEENIQRVRLTYKTPEGANRYLLLGFTKNNEATDDFDYGYDARNTETLPSDLNWSINNENYIIQGVGKFNLDKTYPLEMVLGEKGTIEVALTDLENFENDIDVFLYDAYLKTYTKLNNTDYTNSLEAETYKDRFFITFKESNDTLDNTEETLNKILVRYLSKSKSIFINVPNTIMVNQVDLINVAGQKIKSWNNFDYQTNNSFKIPLKNISEGVYVLKLISDTGTINKKVVINQ